MKLTIGKVLFVWAIIIVAYLWVLTFAITLPSIIEGIRALFLVLDRLTQGVASGFLLVLIVLGSAVTIWYAIDEIIKLIRISRSKISSLIIGSSTMYAAMFDSSSERSARRRFDDLVASPEPRIFILEPTDKRIDGRIRGEVKT